MLSKGKLIVTVLSVVFLTLIFALPVFAQSITLEVTPADTAAEGQQVTLTATDVNLPGVDVGNLEYRFAYRVSGRTKIYIPKQGPDPFWTITIPAGAANTYDLGVQVREAGKTNWSSSHVLTAIVYGYVITEAADDPDPEHSITNVSFTPPSPDTLEFDEYVNFTFDYSTTNPGNVQIWGRPMTEGSLSPNWGGHGSLQHSPPTGSASGFIRIRDNGQTEAQHVDQVRFRMVCVDTSDTLLEIYVDVDYTYEPASEDPEHSITNISFTPPSPDTLEFDEYVNFTFDYSTTNPGNVQIWGRPMTEGSLSPNWGGHGSSHHSPPTGSASGFIRIRDNGQAEAQHVDQVRFRMVCVDTSDTLLEIYVDVDYTYIPPGFDHDFGTGRDGLEGWAFDGTWTQTHSQLHTDGENNKWSSAWYTVREYRNFEYTVVMRSGVSPGDRNQPQYIIIRAGEEFLGNGYWYPGYSFGYIHSVSNQYSVWKRNTNGTSTALKSWAAAAEIVDGWNTLKVRAVDNRFDFYINDTLVDTVFDSAFTVGKVGFAMYDDDGRFSVHRATLTVIED